MGNKIISQHKISNIQIGITTCIRSVSHTTEFVGTGTLNLIYSAIKDVHRPNSKPSNQPVTSYGVAKPPKEKN